MEDSYLEKLVNNEYICLLCNKNIPRKDNARRHIRLKHMQEEGSHWTCDICSKGYKNKLVLDDHYRKIQGVYKTVQHWLEIKIHSQQFSYFNLFWAHSQVKMTCLRWWHLSAWSLLVLASGSAPYAGWSGARKISGWLYPGLKHIHIRYSRRHIEAKHLENTSVTCQQCARTFKTRDSRRKHLCEFDLEHKKSSKPVFEPAVHVNISTDWFNKIM